MALGELLAVVHFNGHQMIMVNLVLDDFVNDSRVPKRDL